MMQILKEIIRTT